MIVSGTGGKRKTDIDVEAVAKLDAFELGVLDKGMAQAIYLY